MLQLLRKCRATRLIAAFPTALSFSLSFAETVTGPSFSYCPKSDGVVAINLDSKTSYKQFPLLSPFELGGGDALDNSRIFSELQRCDTKTHFCVREVSTDLRAKGVFVYAIPKRIKIGDEYSVEGVWFKVYAAPNVGKNKNVVQIVGKALQRPEMQYKMYIADGVGLVGIYFSSILMPPSSRYPEGRAVVDEYCQISGARTLFSLARVRK